jgi:CheY-like chemotaxis protein
MPKMVITDLVMPGMGGYQLIRRLCEMYPRRNVPVIVVSKLNSPDDIVEAELAGASVYCAKPLPISRVVENIVLIAKEGPQVGKMKFVYDLAFSFNASPRA